MPGICDGRVVIVTGGEAVVGRENFKDWIERFLSKINELHLEVI